MDSKTIITLVVSGIVIIAGLSIIMIPMISDMTDNIHSVETNLDDVTYSLVETHAENTIEIENGDLKINGKSFDFVKFSGRTIMFTDSFFVIKTTVDNVDTMSIVTSNGVTINTKKIHLDDNVATITSTTNEVTTLDYELSMIWSEHGQYQFANPAENRPYYVNGDATIYIVGGTSTTGGVFSGTADNIQTVFKIGEPSYELTYTQYTDVPDVMVLTGITSDIVPVAVFLPKEYDVVTPMNEMMKMVINISPVLIGLMFMAAMGMVMVRSTKL